MSTVFTPPLGASCEARGCRVRPVTHIYGPECESETGKLMYLCSGHAAKVSQWRASHLNDPVECPEHGRIGPVRNYLILRRI